MPEYSPKNSLRHRIAPIFFLAALVNTSASQAETSLKAQQAVLDTPEKPVAEVTSPPTQITNQTSSTASSVAPAVQPLYRSLEQASFIDWSAKPVLYWPINRKSAPDRQSNTQNTSASEVSAQDLTSEFGCTGILQKVFSRDQRQIVATAYRFTSVEGAYGAYCCLRKGASNLIAKGDASSEDDRTISFWREKYFVSISGTSADDEESKGIVTKLAKQLAASIATSSPKPRILTRLPGFDRVLGSERIVMGPLSLKKLFPAPYTGTLASANTYGAIADYQVQEPYRARLKFLILQFANPTDATSTFTRYIGQLEEEHDQQEVGGLDYQSSVFKVGNTFMLCQIRNAEMIVITGGRKKPSLAALAKEIH